MTYEEARMYEPVFGSWEDYERHQRAKFLRNIHIAGTPRLKIYEDENGYHEEYTESPY